jgi:hypothetical protein
MTNNIGRPKRKTTDNRTYKKLADQWLNEALCIISSSVLADSFVLRNRQLVVAASRSIQLHNQAAYALACDARTITHRQTGNQAFGFIHI